jgi:hypothetical protein
MVLHSLGSPDFPWWSVTSADHSYRRTPGVDIFSVQDRLSSQTIHNGSSRNPPHPIVLSSILGILYMSRVRDSTIHAANSRFRSPFSPCYQLIVGDTSSCGINLSRGPITSTMGMKPHKKAPRDGGRNMLTSSMAKSAHEIVHVTWRRKTLKVAGVAHLGPASRKSRT